MTFETSREAYDAFMGRNADLLAPRLIAFAGVQPGDRVLDVGCGPGSLTQPLAELVGPEHVAAVDPSESFIAATQSVFPVRTFRSAVRSRCRGLPTRSMRRSRSSS